MAPNAGKTGKTHLRNACELITHARRKTKQYNVEKVLRITPCNPLSKGPLSSYRRKDMGKIADDLASLWGIVKNDPPGYQKIERETEGESVYLF